MIQSNHCIGQDILITFIVLQNRMILVLRNEQVNFASVRSNLST